MTVTGSRRRTAFLLAAQKAALVSGEVGHVDASLRRTSSIPESKWRPLVATYYVTEVRKEKTADGSHEHIEGVCTEAGVHFTRAQVVQNIEAGNVWKTKVAGVDATIRRLDSCPRTNCSATPYITTKADNSIDNNLENLPAC